MVELVVVEGADAGRSFELAGITVVGRDASAGIVVKDEEVSRRHASLASEADGQLSLEDLGSMNGTYVNGERIDETRTLGAGDKIRVGTTVLQVRTPGAVSTRAADASDQRSSRPTQMHQPSSPGPHAGGEPEEPEGGG